MKNHLFIGLGGLGGRSVAELRKVMEARHRDAKRLKDLDVNWAFLSIDSSPDIWNNRKLWTYFGKDVQLAPEQRIALRKDGLTGSLAQVALRAEVSPWLGGIQRVNEFIGGEGGDEIPGANQRRRFGRLLFAMSANEISNEIFFKKVAPLTQQGRPTSCWFHIFATLAGGTGSGGIVDLVTMLRQNYPSSSTDNGFPIFLYLYVTDNDGRAADVGYFYQNQHCALRDLNALMCGRLKTVVVSSRGQPVEFAAKAINTACLSTNINSQNNGLDLNAQVKIMAEAAFERIFAFVAGHLDQDSQKAVSGEDILPTFSGEPLKAEERSYRFGALGMRKWEVPNEQLEELIALDLLIASLRQMLTNHWQAEEGFLAEGDSSSEAESQRMILVTGKTVDDRLASQTKIKDSRAKLSKELEQILRGIERTDQSLETLEKEVDEYLRTRFEGAGLARFANSVELGLAAASDEAIHEIDQHLTRFWLDATNPVGLSNIIVDIDRLTAKLRSELNTSIGSDAAERCRSRRASRKIEWDKLTALSRPLKAGLLLKAHFNDLLVEALAELDKVADDVDREFRRQLIEKLIALRSAYRSAAQALKTLLERATKEQRSVESELLALQAEASANEYEFNKEALQQFREFLRKNETVQRRTSKKARDRVATESRGRTLSRFREDEERKREAVDDELRKSLLSEARDIHSELTDSGQAPSVLGDSLLDRLERRFQGNPTTLSQSAAAFIQRAASCCKLQHGELQPADLLQTPVTTMPKRLCLLGVPRHPFAASIKQAFQQATPGGSRYDLVIYEHDEPAQIRLLISDYWMAARFTTVAHGLRAHYANTGTGEAGQTVRYFSNIDPDGEADKRGEIFVPSADSMRERLQAELWIGEHLEPPNVREDSNGLFLITHSEEGATPKKLGRSAAEFVPNAAIPAIQEISGVVGQAVRGLSDEQRAAIQRKIEDEEKTLKARVALTSKEFIRWSATRKQINRVLSGL